jgi:hypothetical protein
MRYLAIFLVTTALLGCNGYKYPRNEKRALKQLKKSASKINQITAIYPGLIDTVFKPRIDTFLIKSHEVDTLYKVNFDTITVDSLIEKIIEFRSDPVTITKYRDLILQKSIKDTTFFYSDSLVFVKVSVIGGELQVISKLKERKLVVNRNLNQLNIKSGFIKYYKWIIIILLILLIIATLSNGRKHNTRI